MRISLLMSAVLLTASSLAASVAVAAPAFPKGITILDDQHEGVYSTLWTAYPMTIESYDGKKPRNMLVALTADGKMSGFRGIINIDCKEPIYSRIETSDGMSLKEAMADYVLPRPVVNNLFAKFCK